MYKVFPRNLYSTECHTCIHIPLWQTLGSGVLCVWSCIFNYVFMCYIIYDLMLKFWNACQYRNIVDIITSPPEGVARYCFHPVCLCVCVCVCVSMYLCVRPIFWYFISRLLEEISIWNLCRIIIGLYWIHWKKIHRSKVKVTGTVHCFLKVQSYHKNWAIENFQYFLVDTYLYALSNETIKTWASREMTSQKIRQYLTFNM